ncbi:MAG: 50S ribosomal protein L25 [Thermodesulfobacteriota bacterium]
MEEIELSARPREETGKGATGRLRRDGFIPAVLYGPNVKKSLSLTLNAREIDKILHGHAGGNVLMSLKLEGSKAKKVMFKSLDRHPVMDDVRHIDLMEILMDKAVTVPVPIHVVGKCEGVEFGGILQQEMREIKVECLPSHIPDSIDVDVTALVIGSTLHIKDITLPADLKAVDDPELTVIRVAAPIAEVEEKTPEELEAELAESFEEKAEGEAAPGEKPEEKSEEKTEKKAEKKE